MMLTENKGPEFDRIQILNRYWELANLNPDKTKGTIQGQLKALDSLCELLSLAIVEKPRQHPPQVEVYRASWLRQQDERPIRTLKADNTEEDPKFSREALKKARPFPTTQ
jgi:hypothetical protein